MSMYIFLIIIVVLAAIGIPVYLKKRKQKAIATAISSRQNKDEVWKTIKQFLKDNDEYGKEIVDSYVIKRNSIDYINPRESRYERANKKQEIKIRNFQYRQLKKTAKNDPNFHAKKSQVKPKERDLYVVSFITRDTKTHQLDEPRMIECEVVNKKINKKQWDRKILINGLLDYDKEMEWIAPLKNAEAQKNAKLEAKRQAIEAKNQAKLEAKKQKQRAKLAAKKQKENDKA